MKVTKSRKLRKVFVKTPGGEVVNHYKDRKIKGVFCGNCQKKLNIRVLAAAKFKNLSKSKKRSNRGYSNICSSCSRRLIIQNTRLKFNTQ